MSGGKRSVVRKIWNFVETYFEQILSVFFLSTMVVLLTAIVFFRFVLHRGLSFAVEIERMAFVWFVYMGAAYAARERRHIRVVAQFTALSERARKIVRIISDILWLLFNVVIIREGIRVVYSMIEYPYESPALGISMAYVYTIVPLSFILISVRICQNVVGDIKQLRNERKE